MTLPGVAEVATDLPGLSRELAEYLTWSISLFLSSQASSRLNFNKMTGLDSHDLCKKVKGERL